MKDYEKVHCKQEGGPDSRYGQTDRYKISLEDIEVLKIAAHGYYKRKIEQAVRRYIVDQKFKETGLQNRLEQVASIAETYQYDPEQGIRKIKKYLEHINEKEEKQNIQKNKGKAGRLIEAVFGILNHSLEETLDIKTKHENLVMGIKKEEILSAAEVGTVKLQLLLQIARYKNKLGKEL